MEDILFFLEIMGTVAFAISGAVLGIRKRMDIFGVSILGLTTGVGGGKFDPAATCTRAQIAAFLARLYAEK